MITKGVLSEKKKQKQKQNASTLKIIRGNQT